MQDNKGGSVAIRLPECGVDYLTMTWHDEIRNTALMNTRMVIEWAERQKGAGGLGSISKPWAWEGYAGWQCGQLCVGERHDGTILRMSGVIGHRWLAQGLPTGHNVSRIDVALTVWGCFCQKEQIALHSAEADYHRKTLHSRPYKVRLIDGFGEGDTCYIGSRQSSQFVRIYDKELEQSGDKQYKGAIRYECECKEQLALQALTRCTSGGYSAARCLSVLLGLLARRAVRPLDTWGVDTDVLQPSQLPNSSLESSLSWLEKQVSPTVKRLIREGYEEEVLTALGLGRYFNQGFAQER